MEEVAKLLDGLATLAWPVLIGIALFRLWPLVRDIARNRAFTIRYGETELSVQDASDQLRKQLEDLQEQVSSMLDTPDVPPTGPRELHSEDKDRHSDTILWVDDKPKNNAYEAEKFRDDGFQVVQVKSTSEAQEWITAYGHPAIVITDMGRNEDGKYVPDAGLQLIRKLREADVGSPIFVYTSKTYAQRHHDQSLEAGGSGATASPLALYQMVAKAEI